MLRNKKKVTHSLYKKVDYKVFQTASDMAHS